MGSDSIAKKWRDLSGQSKWQGLLDPLDIDLRRYIIHYGQLAQATYDAFNSEKKSIYAGNSLYPIRDFFSNVGLEKGNPYKYDVKKFIYATCKSNECETLLLKIISKEEWSLETNWIGYVAVATNETKELLGRRDIVVAWRGTIQAAEWVGNVKFQLDEAPLIFGDKSPAEIHRGFYNVYTSANPDLKSAYTSARDQVRSEIERLMEQYENEEVSITITGHSLGGALAIINATDIVIQELNKPRGQPQKARPVTVFAFASPHVGNSSFADIFSNTQNLHALLIRNKDDKVPKVLGRLRPLESYKKVGEELKIDTGRSKDLKSGASKHNLEAYLHGVAGTQGSEGQEFKLVVNRDRALLNKTMDGLEDESVPVEWRSPANKGMVQDSDGNWKIMDYYYKTNILRNAKL